jgi:phospholipid/cholesterol/gamma-HCH transport system ATP-binding protein
MSEPILQVEGIVNRFGRQTVHDGVSFSIDAGEIIGIVGGSGSGKSVLLKTILGLRKANAGKVTIAGKSLASLNPAQRASLLGVLFQQGALFSSMTVAQNIMLPLKEHTALSGKDRARVAQLKIGLAGLPPEAGLKYPSQLSGGMIKRASLARALALDPAILFLDEPTAGLDPVAASEFDQLIVELNKSLGVTVVMVTHDLDTIYELSTRVAVVADKHVLVDAPLHEVIAFDHPFVRDFFLGGRGLRAMELLRQPPEAV